MVSEYSIRIFTPALMIKNRVLRRPFLFTSILLAIEFLDEFVFGGHGAALPFFRNDLHLDYFQIGMLLGVPLVIGNLVEPAIGILGDVWKRRALVLGGGIAFAVSLFLTGVSGSFLLLLFSFVLFNPASGAFVSLSQATLMDLNPARHAQNMARWTLAGSLGVLLGPIALSALVVLGLTWRELYLTFGCLALILVTVSARFPFSESKADAALVSFKVGVINAMAALRRGAVVRWLLLLEFADLMLDILLGFIALYFVDIAHLSESEAALAVALWTGAHLAGDLVVILLLERVEGLMYLRLSALAELILLPAFLLTPNTFAKLALLALIGFSNAGWYPVLKGKLYSAMPGQSWTVTA